MDVEEVAGVESEEVSERIERRRRRSTTIRSGTGGTTTTNNNRQRTRQSRQYDDGFDDADDAAVAVTPSRSAFSPHSIAAGYVAGIAGVLVGHPLDSLKVLIQLRGKPVAASAPPTTPVAASAQSALPAPQARTVLSLRQLYAGVQGPLLTIGLVQALNFGVYDAMRQWLHHRRRRQEWQRTKRSSRSSSSSRESMETGNYHAAPVHLHDAAVASLVAGGVISTPTGLLHMVKIRQQQDPSLTLRQAMQSVRLRVLWNAKVPHVLCESVGRMIYLTVYEFLKAQIRAVREPVVLGSNDSHHHNKRSNDDDDDDPAYTDTAYELSLSERMLCAGLAGVAAWTLIFPADVLRSRLLAHTTRVGGHPQHHHQPPTPLALARTLYRSGGGWRSFYRGLPVALVRAAPVAAAVLPVYDTAHQWLSRHA